MWPDSLRAEQIQSQRRYQYNPADRAEYLAVLLHARFQVPSAVVSRWFVVIRLILMADCRADLCDRSYVGSSYVRRPHNLLLYDAFARKPSPPIRLATFPFTSASHSFRTYCTLNSLIPIFLYYWVRGILISLVPLMCFVYQIFINLFTKDYSFLTPFPGH